MKEEPYEEPVKKYKVTITETLICEKIVYTTDEESVKEAALKWFKKYKENFGNDDSEITCEVEES